MKQHKIPPAVAKAVMGLVAEMLTCEPQMMLLPRERAIAMIRAVALSVGAGNDSGEFQFNLAEMWVSLPDAESTNGKAEPTEIPEHGHTQATR